jgi:hypothetical protein
VEWFSARSQSGRKSFGAVLQNTAPSELQRISVRESAEITAGKLPAIGCSSERLTSKRSVESSYP